MMSAKSLSLLNKHGNRLARIVSEDMGRTIDAAEALGIAPFAFTLVALTAVSDVIDEATDLDEEHLTTAWLLGRASYGMHENGVSDEEAKNLAVTRLRNVLYSAQLVIDRLTRDLIEDNFGSLTLKMPNGKRK